MFTFLQSLECPSLKDKVCIFAFFTLAFGDTRSMISGVIFFIGVVHLIFFILNKYDLHPRVWPRLFSKMNSTWWVLFFFFLTIREARNDEVRWTHFHCIFGWYQSVYLSVVGITWDTLLLKLIGRFTLSYLSRIHLISFCHHIKIQRNITQDHTLSTSSCSKQ